MKQINLIIALTFATTFSAFAQFTLGISAGANYSNSEIINIDNISSSARTSYFFGLNPKVNITDKLTFKLDLLYSDEGFILNDSLENRLSYLRVIPQLQYRLADFIGFNVGVNYGSKLKEEYELLIDHVKNVNIDKLVKSDYGLSFGGSLYFGSFYLDVRYYHGLQNILDPEFKYLDDLGNEVEDVKQSMRNIQVGVGYYIL